MMDFALFNWFDYTLVIIIVLSFGFGLMRGFAKETISCFTWFAAFFISIIYTDNLAIVLSQYFKTQFVASIVSFVFLFLVTLIIGGLINYIVAKFIQKTGLSCPNRLLGGLFGLARGVLVAILVVFLISNTALQAQSFFEKSQLTVRLQTISSWMQDHVMAAAATTTIEKKENKDSV